GGGTDRDVVGALRRRLPLDGRHPLEDRLDARLGTDGRFPPRARLAPRRTVRKGRGAAQGATALHPGQGATASVLLVTIRARRITEMRRNGAPSPSFSAESRPSP